MKNNCKGKLIVIEGLDGSGKATQSQILLKRMVECKLKVQKVSFPDYNEPSSNLVKMYLNSELGKSPEDVNAYAASSFFAVDRFASYARFWKDFYLSGGIVIADRYTTSNAVYHMGKLPCNQWDDYISWLEDFEYNKLELPRPNTVIYLDMPVNFSQSLIKKRYEGDLEKKDLHEKNILFLKTCYNSAEYAIKKLGWKKISCISNGNIKDVNTIAENVFSVSMEAMNA